MYYGFGLFGMAGSILLSNINFIISDLAYVIYVIIITRKLNLDPLYDDELVGNYLLISFIAFLYSLFHIRNSEIIHRLQFKNERRIQKLLMEQRDVFENLPDGLIIHNDKKEDVAKHSQI